ncbi:MAG: 50S ribosomal protein L11 methyltransferase [Candidatus Eremiobacteraeota bacterium]|nr:50S ribosomal protein L11 methyltransferase [Candidatus Eremiobacteraeota bacterium]
MEYYKMRLCTSPELIPYAEYLLQAHHISAWSEETYRTRQCLVFYLPADGAAEDILERLSLKLKGLEETKLSKRKIRALRWEKSWKRSFKTISIGTIVIKPPWRAYKASPGEAVIEIEPGMAFGTGDHHTTSLCIRLLQSYVKPGMKVIDLGTGSALLAMAAIALGASSVTAVDHDPVALTEAQTNVIRMGMGNRIALVRDEVTDVPPGSYDLAVGNLFLREIAMLLEKRCPPLRQGGVFIGSGITTDQRPQVEKALLGPHFALLSWQTGGIWDAFAVRKEGP